MIEKLEEQLRNYRLEFYKKAVFSLSEVYEEKNIAGKHKIDKDNFCIALELFIEQFKLDDIAVELVTALQKYWNNLRMVGTYTKPIKLKYNGILFTFKTDLVSCANENLKDIEKINKTKKLISFLSDDSRELFTDFSFLKELFENMPLNKNEKADFFVQIVELNNERLVSKNYILPINEEYLKTHTKGLNRKVINNLAKYNMLEEYMRKDQNIFNYIIKQARKLDYENPYDITDFAGVCRIISTGIELGKLNTPEYKVLALPCFSNLGFEDLYQSVVYRSEQRIKMKQESVIEERSIKEKTVQDIDKQNKNDLPKESPVQDVVTFTAKELKVLRRKVNENYDFDEHVCLKTLSMDEIIETIAILIVLKTDKETIDKFIFNAEKNLRQNPYVAYREFMEKIMSMVTDPLALEYLDELRDIIESKPSAKVLEQAKDNANRCIRYINQFIDNDYSYEYNLAKEKVRELSDGKGQKSM